jgi:hypothetical protein
MGDDGMNNADIDDVYYEIAGLRKDLKEMERNRYRTVSFVCLVFIGLRIVEWVIV